MCLIIRSCKHIRLKNGKYIPRTTLFHKKVYKVLCYELFTGAHTPIICKPVIFKDDKCCLSGKFSYYYGGVIEEGVHSFSSYTMARDFANSVGGFIYKAYIPSGVKYFIGFEGQIVSEKLIVKNDIIIEHGK